MTFRSRGDIATVHVDCHDEQHVVRVSLDGEITTSHDRDLDAVLVALGEAPHPCQVAENSYRAALEIDRVTRGLADPAGLRAVGTNRRWETTTPCPQCLRNRPNHPTPVGTSVLTHFIHPTHLAATMHADATLITHFTKWLSRRITDPDRIPPQRSRNTPAAAECFRQLLGHPLTPYDRHTWLLTLRYLEAFTTVAGLPAANRTPVYPLVTRYRGLRAEWLTELASAVTPQAINRAVHAHSNDHDWWLRSLFAARNIPAATIARYLNHGITTHLYTYAKYQATPEQILAVYRATNGQATLADYLNNGTSIPDALTATHAAA